MLKDHNYNKELPMIHQISHQDLEHVYADAVNTIQCEMNFVEAVKALEDAAKAGHGKAAMFLAELYYQGFRVERDSLKAQYWQKMRRKVQQRVDRLQYRFFSEKWKVRVG
jgi:TPR repeat protein